MRLVTSLSLVAASATLLAPARPATAARPQASPPPASAAEEHGDGPVTGDAAGQGGAVPRRPGTVTRERGILTRENGRASRGHRVAAADLLAEVRHCTPLSRGRYRSDPGKPADIPVCGRHGAVFWKADMDIDCDGRPGRHCNRRTDPYFTRRTAFQRSDALHLSAETVPYIVVPAPSRIWNHRAHGVRGGSVAAVIHGDRVQYAVVGDTGPRDIIGEASYAAAKGLGIRPDPRAGGTDSGVTYLVFPDSVVSPIEDHDAAAALGERLARKFLRGK